MRLVVAGCVGDTAVAYAYYWYDLRFTKDEEEEEQRSEEQHPTAVTRLKTEFPNLPNSEAITGFFQENIKLGEECLKSGRIDQGIKYLSNTVAIHTNLKTYKNL